MPQLRPAYLIHGDDHGAIAERRAGLRALAEAEAGGGTSVELLEGDVATPAGVAQALATMTLSVGRRVIIVDGVERWRQADVEGQLLPAMGEMPPETTLALFAREDTRTKAPPAVAEAVRGAGGQVVAQATVKPWELPKWAREQAARMGLALDAAAAKTLVAQVGERQQRLLRELEKLALETDPGEAGPGGEAGAPGEAGSPGDAGSPGGSPAAGAPRAIGVQEIEDRAAHSAEWRVYGLADALLAGDGREATRSYLRLREQGERLAGLGYLMAQRLRDALAVALRLEKGESPAEIKRTLRMPSRAAERFVADAARSDPDRLRAALAALADLELDSRGGQPLPQRSPGDQRAAAALSEDTLTLRTIEAITR